MLQVRQAGLETGPGPRVPRARCKMTGKQSTQSSLRPQRGGKSGSASSAVSALTVVFLILQHGPLI